jgi:hypothetical protein
MTLDRGRRQSGHVDAIPLGARVRDMEGITTDGTYVYVVGSQSKKDSQPGVGLARFKFDPTSRHISDVQTVADLKSLVFSALPEVERAAGRKTDGFNIEGLSWDAQRRRLLLGLRSPTPNGHALIIPMTLRDADGPLTRDNLAIGTDLIRLQIDGGIRSIEFDAVAGHFWIISGAAANREAGFAFWKWSGAGAPIRERVVAEITDRSVKPEGITRVRDGAESYTFVVFDTSRYTTITN